MMIRRAAVLACLTAGFSACGGSAGSGPGGTIAVSGGGVFEPISLISPKADSTRALAVVADRALDADLSPDGRHIAIAGIKGLWITNRAGTDARRILDEQRLDVVAGAVAWSPDGRRLAFVRDDSLYTIEADGSGLTLVTRNADAPTGSPDGSEIIFVRNPEQSSRDGIISAIRPDGHGLHRLVTRGEWFGPAVSPDGSKLAIYRNGGRGVYVAPATGGRPRLVIRNGFQPKWSPDGRYLAFLRDVRCGEALCSSRTFVVPASGGTAHPYGPVIGDMVLLSWSR
jgi:Tol biopolymer transport system component